MLPINLADVLSVGMRVLLLITTKGHAAKLSGTWEQI